ncbi:hypothetical protein PhCBS80983_g01621 [Powellomyces hirtus]|uniref:Transmembrane protein 19 n=1 Tax=Powellomyces hirtus TaxID=109895 RepID=A0A507E9H0_9FUNG|nr:hypothetical protein PhCBS80983_g01621 [Powellomyces hirtus]
MHPIAALVLCSLLVVHGIRKKSLSSSGAMAASVVGFITFVGGRNANLLFAGVLLGFYLLGSRATKYKQDRKKELEEDFQEGGQRTARQVLANGLTGTVACALHYYLIPLESSAVCYGQVDDANSMWHTILVLVYLGHYACCCGDTWASEIGILSTETPILITTLKRVPRGTNGGVSSLGLAASVAGGFVIGIIAAVGLPLGPTCGGMSQRLQIVFLGALGGLLGSLIDSLLGATLQKSEYNTATAKIAADGRRLRIGEKPTQLQHISGIAILDNHQVNFISSLMTGVL